MSPMTEPERAALEQIHRVTEFILGEIGETVVTPLVTTEFIQTVLIRKGIGG